ncbi:uncharacterized protein LOC126740693 [Anthonomus grandis grandis]|uniref:uncharacterized protein LOC126740693 n=1 Tax=Anthonomus grandis grandis TaxID=2921223 RepID=UPI002165E8E6|nr:uncharacterized protein LOC126740693 [Anthonomus grandis grandis]
MESFFLLSFDSRQSFKRNCLKVATREEVKEGPKTEIIIYSDSQAALKAIQASSDQLQEERNALDTLGRRKTVRVCWVPGHSGVEGNERADEFARLGSALPPISREPYLQLSEKHIFYILDNWT